MLKVLDTSVLFRLYDDKVDPLLKREVKVLLEKEKIFIPCEVVVELSYLLRKSLRMTKREVLRELEKLFLRDNVLLEPECREALSLWVNSTLDKLADALILVKSKKRGATLITLDEEMEKTYGECNTI